MKYTRDDLGVEVEDVEIYAASHWQRWRQRGKAFEFLYVSDEGLVRFRKI
ncbi:hypothetical protein Tco_0069673, partial [Tanacetum coccineum]